jgi:hypothetical protein
MQERYGLDRRPVGRWAATGVVVIAFVAVLAWVSVAITGSAVQARLISWDAAAPDHVSVTFEIERRDPAAEVDCVVRAQDQSRIDVGYATVVIPGGTAQVSTTYALRTLAPAYTTELLGCAVGEAPRVPPPQFPPGVVPPAQPYS